MNMLETRKMAAALSYTFQSGEVPKVVAAGAGELATRIIEAAEAAGVPVHQDAGLAARLVGLQLQAEIPVELYRAVAGVLAVVMSLDRLGDGKIKGM